MIDDNGSLFELHAPSEPIHRRRRSSINRFSVGSVISHNNENIEINLEEDISLAEKPDDIDELTSNIKDIDIGETDLDHLYDPIFNPRIKDFETLKVLGVGAYGKVLLVRNQHSKKLFARKQLKKALILVSKVAVKTPISANTKENEIPEIKSKNKSIERAIAERDILVKIRHHFIVKLFYCLQDLQKIYLYLKFVPGGELFYHLGSQFFDEKTCAFYAAEMTLALLHLHKLGIVYRDLKPENCLLDSNGHLILTDFGLSKIGTMQDEYSCNSIIGTPEYMAPEVLKGEDYGFKVDWWSLGAVIFDMMTGKPPFTGNNHKVIFEKILTKKIKYPYYFSSFAKELLNKLLQKDAKKRLDIDGEFDKFKKMKFFSKVDWDMLADENKFHNIKPPIVPLVSDPVLAENFDSEFTNMKISLYDQEYDQTEEALEIDNPLSSENQDLFQGFSYTASNSYIEKFL